MKFDDDVLLKAIAAGGAAMGALYAGPDRKCFHDIYFTEKEGFSAASNRYAAAVNVCFGGAALAVSAKDVPKKTKKNVLKAAGVGFAAASGNAAYNSLTGKQHKNFGLGNSVALAGLSALCLVRGFKKD